MNTETHFLPPEKLIRTAGRKMEFDVVKNIQGFSEKILTDVINRAALLARHVDSEVIDVSEIAIVIEKDFDYSFGMRSILNERNTPANEHIERLAELSRQK